MPSGASSGIHHPLRRAAEMHVRLPAFTAAVRRSAGAESTASQSRRTRRTAPIRTAALRTASANPAFSAARRCAIPPESATHAANSATDSEMRSAGRDVCRRSKVMRMMLDPARASGALSTGGFRSFVSAQAGEESRARRSASVLGSGNRSSPPLPDPAQHFAPECDRISGFRIRRTKEHEKRMTDATAEEGDEASMGEGYSRPRRRSRRPRQGASRGAGGGGSPVSGTTGGSPR